MIRCAALATLLFAAPFGLGAEGDKKAALIETMNANGCQLTTAQASEQLPGLGIDRATAIKLSREMMAEGIATFAADEETLLLLPPACTG